MSAVFKAMTLADELKNTNDIRQLDLAVQGFLTRYQVPYMPSQLKLCRSSSSYNTSLNTSGPNIGAPMFPVDYDSFQYLSRLWPRLGGTSGTWSINWDGSTSGSSTDKWTLQGQECLVFFLGGIPGNVGGTNVCQGFSTDPANPAGATRIRPSTILSRSDS